MKRVITSLLLFSVLFAIGKPIRRKKSVRKNQLQLIIKNPNPYAVYVTLSKYNWIKARWSKPRIKEIKAKSRIKLKLPKKSRSTHTLYWDVNPVTKQDIQNRNFQGSKDIDIQTPKNRMVITIPALTPETPENASATSATNATSSRAVNTAKPMIKPAYEYEGDVTETTIGQTKETSAPSAGQRSTIVPLVKVNPKAPQGIQDLIGQVNQAITGASQGQAGASQGDADSLFNLIVTNSSAMRLYITFRDTQWSNNSTTEITRNVNANSAMQIQLPKKTESDRILYWNDKPLTNQDIKLKKFMGFYNIGNEVNENEKSIIISK